MGRMSNPTGGTSNSGKTDTTIQPSPNSAPTGTLALNSRNRLHEQSHLFPTAPEWYRFDLVNPIPPPGVSDEFWEPSGLVIRAHNAGCDKLNVGPPTNIQKYVPKWRVVLEYEPSHAFPTEEFLIPVTFHPLNKEGQDSTSQVPNVFKIHCGYSRLLIEFNHNISHGRTSNVGSALWRMTYAQQVIDTFADELFSRRHVEGGLKWRSRVLNPILQRQLQGMGHESLLSAHFIGLEGKELNEAIDEFYLHRDPLQPSQQNTLRWGVIYATDARWSLTVSTNPQMIGDECHYNQCRIHTRSLIKTLVYKGADSEELENLEVAVVVSENIDHHFSVLYPGIIQEAISRRDRDLAIAVAERKEGGPD